MTNQAGFALRGRNPDVLTCIANLSNDEVFTPPEFANGMLDTLTEAWAEANQGADIWSDPTVAFLDPVAKSGIFLREITARLTNGLEGLIPDLQERVDHILTKQVFGIGLTDLTSLLARRSVYCSKHANGEHSIVSAFRGDDGNIWFERLEHTWEGQRCKYCGASKASLDRDEGLETHAYPLIHTDDVKARMAEFFGGDMQFDVIIGNPPYQLDDGGHGASAVPIYQKFVEAGKRLDPRFLTMVIPSRWFFGGRGLDGFRSTMLTDSRVRKLVDYVDSRQAFDNVDVAGGVCYFLWDRDNEGDCEVVANDLRDQQSVTVRPLLEPGAEIFIRSNEAIAILKKIVLHETGEPGVVLPVEMRFQQQVSAQKPFGLRTYFRGFDQRQAATDVEVLQSGGRAYASRADIQEGVDLIDKWKAFTSKSSSEHAGQADRNGMRRVLSLSGVLGPGSVVTETYILLGTYDSEQEARNCLSYAMTKFFRFLLATRTSAQDLSRSAYSFVPAQDFSEPWTDAMLYSKYDLSRDEIALIEATIRPMDAPDG